MAEPQSHACSQVARVADNANINALHFRGRQWDVPSEKRQIQGRVALNNGKCAQKSNKLLCDELLKV